MNHGHKKHHGHSGQHHAQNSAHAYHKRAYRFDSEFCIGVLAESFALIKTKRYANISITGIAFDDGMKFSDNDINKGAIIVIECYIHGCFEVPSLFVRRHNNGLAVFDFLDPPAQFVKAVQDYSDEMMLEHGFEYLEHLKTAEKERMIVDVIHGII